MWLTWKKAAHRLQQEQQRLQAAHDAQAVRVEALEQALAQAQQANRDSSTITVGCPAT
jgi:hypothetical protein